MRRLPVNLFFTICLFLVLFVSCQVKTPEDIIQPNKMEALLYDYHIVQAMGNEIDNTQEYHVKLYHDYVFKKHGVTKSYFDSSMVWYTRHPSHLTQIYANLQERLDNEVAIMQDERVVELETAQISKDVTKDTLDLWNGKSVTELRASPNNNRFSFFFESDSAFVEGDSIVLNINARFFSTKKSVQNIYAAVLVAYNDKTTESVAMNINSSGVYSLQLPRNYERKIKRVSGFVFYDDDNNAPAKSGVALSGLSLLRIHPPISDDNE